jgi:endonuclease/exonuclease/phosphatase family metal-dependent hydrolase
MSPAKFFRSLPQFCRRSLPVIALLLMLLPAQAAPANTPNDATPVRVLTFNIRLSLANDGENAWAKRKAFLADVITTFPDGNGPYDFVGTQETVLHPDPALNQRDYLADNLPGYAHTGISREKNKNRGEGMILFWKTARWRLDAADNGTFWLSATPDVPGSKAKDAACPRSVTYGLFHEIKTDGTDTGRRVYVYNTHFDHVGESARQHGAKILLERIASRKNKAAPVVVMGDLNSPETSATVRYLQGEKSEFDGTLQTPVLALTDTFRAANPDAKEVGTFNSFKKRGKTKIDYIFITAPLKTLSSKIILTTRNGRFPSDHFPVEAILEFQPPPQ